MKTPSTARKSCQHCGAPFLPKRPEEVYCCHGCESVALLIFKTGLDNYYSLKSGISEPVLDTPFEERDWTWLTDRVKQSVNQRAQLHISGIACAGCAWLALQVIERQGGYTESHIDVAGKRLSLAWGLDADLPALARQLQRFGFIIEEKAPATAKPPSRIPLIFAALFAMNIGLFQLPRLLQIEDFALMRIFDLMSVLCGVLAIVITGHYLTQQKRYRQSLKS